MLIKIFSSKYCKSQHEGQNEITAFFHDVENAFSSLNVSPIFNTLEVGLLLAPKSDLQKGLFKELMEFSWVCGVATVGVNGDYERYINGDNMVKVDEVYNMLLKACAKLKKNRKAKFDVEAMKNTLHQTYRCYLQNRERDDK